MYNIQQQKRVASHEQKDEPLSNLCIGIGEADVSMKHDYGQVLTGSYKL